LVGLDLLLYPVLNTGRLLGGELANAVDGCHGPARRALLEEVSELQEQRHQPRGDELPHRHGRQHGEADELFRQVCGFTAHEAPQTATQDGRRHDERCHRLDQGRHVRLVGDHQRVQAAQSQHPNAEQQGAELHRNTALLIGSEGCFHVAWVQGPRLQARGNG